MRLRQSRWGLTLRAFSPASEVLYAHDYAGEGKGALSTRIQTLGLSVLKRYRDEALSRGCRSQNIRGIATAVFRKCSNGQQFLDRVRKEMGIDVRCIEQDLEGRVGYRTGLALWSAAPESKAYAGGKGPGSSLAPVVWDSGGGSFQITTDTGRGKVKMFGGRMGSTTVTKIAVELQNKSFATCKSPNPLSRDGANAVFKAIDARVVKLLPAPKWLSGALNAGVAVVGIGGTTCAFRVAALACQKNPFGPKDIETATQQFVSKTDKQIGEMKMPQPAMVLPKLALVCSVMRRLGIIKLHYQQSNGSTRGLAVSPEIWS